MKSSLLNWNNSICFILFMDSNIFMHAFEIPEP